MVALSAVIPTRGDVDLDEIVETIQQVVGLAEIVIYNNAGSITTLRPPGAQWRSGDFTYVAGPGGALFIDGGEFEAPHPNLSVYARYAAIERTTSRLIYTQDDDAVLPPESIAALLALWQPGYVVCNMPERFRAHYSDTALVGFGAVFERVLPARAFERLFPIGLDADAPDPLFLRECDTVFTGLTPLILADVPYADLPHATGSDRLYRQAEHVGQRQRMIRLVRQVRDG